LKIDKTATGSVADIRDQKSKQAKNGISSHKIGKIQNNKNAITNDEIKSQTTDKILIDFQFKINCLYFML